MIDTKTMGWLQLLAGFVGLWGVWQGNYALSTGILALVMLIMGWHHIEGKGHKNF